MAPIIEISEKILKTLNPKDYTLVNIQQKQIADLDTSNFIMLPQEFTGRNYAIEVSLARNSNNPAVKKVGKELRINYQNTSKDSLKREFVGNNNWYESLKMNLALGGRTLDSREFIGLGNLLFQGMNGKVKVYDISGKQIDKQDCQRYFEDIFKVQSPRRSEWIGTNYKFENEKLFAELNHKLEGGILVPQNSEVLDVNTLIQDKQISLEDYLQNSTKQGLPRETIELGEFYYWAPNKDNNSVARSYASSDWSDFDANGNPSYSSFNLGVRFAKQIE